MKPSDSTPVATPTPHGPHTSRETPWIRWRRAQTQSLRHRLLALGLMPLLVAFPAVIAVLWVVGGHQADALLEGNLRGHLAATRNYLEGVKVDTRAKVSQQVRSTRLAALIGDPTQRQELNRTLSQSVETSGLHYLLVVDAEGRILGSSADVSGRLPVNSSHVIRQALIGVTTVAFERFEAEQLESLSPALAAQSRVQRLDASGAVETRGLLINAAAHFPLSVDSPDAVLVGGILLNRNQALIDHLREVIYPVGSLPDNAEGMNAILVDRVTASASRQRLQGERRMGHTASDEVAEQVLQQGQSWIGRLEIGDTRYYAGYEAIQDGEGRRVGMLASAFPDAPYERMVNVVLLSIGALMALTLLAISGMFVRAGREFTNRVGAIVEAMNTVRSGRRDARAGTPLHDDELGDLARTFNELLDTIAAQERARQAVTDELDRHRLHLEQLVEQRTRELLDRTEQLDAIFALSPDGFVSFDREHRVRFVNQAFAAITDIPMAQMLGADEVELSEQLARRGPAGRAFPGLEALRAAAAQEPGDTAHEAIGSEQSGRTAARQLFELDGPPPRIIQAGLRTSAAANVSQVLYLRDVTHETQVDRMKSEFLNTAAHELRTPMTSIFGFAQLLRAREMEAGKRQQVIDTILRQSELMIAIINQLLDLARIEARMGSDFEMQRLPLQQVIELTVTDFRPPEGRSSPIVEECPQAPLVLVDPQKLQQALMNVLSNAYKYSPDGGEVRVGCRVRTVDGTDQVGVRVQDQGIGMTEHQRNRVFERFYRADASGNVPGTGLGMAIVKEIVELLGGQVELDSTPGQGTRVTLWLPVAKQSSD